MDYQNARIAILDRVADDLLEEAAEWSRDVGKMLNVTEFKDTAYEELVANEERSVVLHILDYTEEEVMSACDRALDRRSARLTQRS